MSTTYAHAATISASASTVNTTVGKTFTVKMIVATMGQSINAVSGKIHFSNDLITLTGIAKSSLVPLWAQEPTYSNATGNATFQAVILNGYSGSSGTLLTLTFKAKASGTARIELLRTGSSVLLNDGQGTDVLAGTNDAAITIADSPYAQSTDGAPSQSVPAIDTSHTTVETPTVFATPSAQVVVPTSAPVITDYQSVLVPGNFVVVKGTTVPGAPLNVTFVDSTETGTSIVNETTITASDTGVFAYISDQKAVEGHAYTVTVATLDGKQASPVIVQVKNGILYTMFYWLKKILQIQISAFMALLLVGVITAYLLYYNHMLKQYILANTPKPLN